MILLLSSFVCSLVPLSLHCCYIYSLVRYPYRHPNFFLGLYAYKGRLFFTILLPSLFVCSLMPSSLHCCYIYSLVRSPYRHPIFSPVFRHTNEAFLCDFSAFVICMFSRVFILALLLYL